MNIKHNLIIFLLSFSLIACGQDDNDQLYKPPTQVATDTVFLVDFKKRNLGEYNDNAVSEDFKNIKWATTLSRATIVNDAERGNVLQVLYPKGSVGPQEGGIQFVRTLSGSREYYLDYYLKFDTNFDFGLGGKLPGLTSGGEKYTGGINPTEGDGWSARYMWTDNLPQVYLYYVDMADKYGEAVKFSVKFSRNKWYRLTQRVKINDADVNNAIITVWLDGVKVAEKTNFRLRVGNKGLIDSFYFSTFHGGATPDWAPQNDCYIYFDKIMVTTKPVKF